MKQSRYTEGQIIAVLQGSRGQHEGPAPVSHARDLGRHDLQVALEVRGLEVSEVRRLKALDDENRRFESLVADLTLDNQALKLVVSKKW